MVNLRRIAIMPMAALLLAACQTGGAGSVEPSTAASMGTESQAAAATVCEGTTDGHLARICEAGTIVVSTDPAYPPQSFLNEETGEYEGFDIDTALEIGERLGVEVEFTDPAFDAVVAGNWSERWDMSVGSVTITPERAEVLDFTQPYYFTPAQMYVLEDSEFQSLEDLAGQVVCAGASTTYIFWIEGTLTLPEEAGEMAPVPEGMTATSLPTDIDCAEAWRGGREEFQGWLTALPTGQGAIDSGRYEIRAVGDPVFYEPLGVAFDKAVEDNDSLVAAVDAIIGEMHADGSLSASSEEWYDGIDYTVQE